MSHTPGPWKVVESAGGTVQIAHSEDAHGRLADVIYRGATPFSMPESPVPKDYMTSVKAWSRERELSDARLIAAAPELLEALKEYQRAGNAILGTGHDYAQDAEGRDWLIGVYGQAVAAIAKAEGREA